MHRISPSGWATVFCGVVLLGGISCTVQTQGEGEIRDVGSRLELFVDDWLIESMQGAELRLHHPVPRDRVWEGSGPDGTYVGLERAGCYVTVFQDGDIYRMYYRSSAEVVGVTTPPHESPNQVWGYAESRDGIHWDRPALGLFETTDGKPNNIVWAGVGCHNFTPFKDTNPNCRPEARYKAVGRTFIDNDPAPPTADATGYKWLPGCGLLAFQSPDGIHWSLMQEERIIKKGEFDSQNVAFWDEVGGCYVAYERIWQKDGARIRGIAVLSSDDFLHWTDPPQWLEYGDAPREHFYTNAIRPYFRAPHILMGFPMRLVGGRIKIPDNPLAGEHAVDDTVFMTSRDGVRFHRWLEGFIRPGPQAGRWWNENSHTAWGILVTKSDIAGAPNELSFYSNEYYATNRSCVRRYTLRMDGFVSVHADYSGGEFTTKPLTFAGKELVMN